MLFAGCTSVIAKMGLAGISGELGLALRTCFVFGMVLGFAAWAVPREQLSQISWVNVAWLALSGLTTSLSWIFYYKALKEGDVSTIAIIDKGSMLVAVALAALFLKEELTWRTWSGCALMTAGILLLVKK